MVSKFRQTRLAASFEFPLRRGGAERQQNRQQAGGELVAAQGSPVACGRNASQGDVTSPDVQRRHAGELEFGRPRRLILTDGPRRG
jgi:hypothetical protein